MAVTNDKHRNRVFFMHIPKTAGTSINTYLAGVFGAPVCEFHLESRRHVLAALAEPAYQHITVAAGHIKLPQVRSMASCGKWQIITCLRNPVEQLLSHLRWLKHVGRPSAEAIRLRYSPQIQTMSVRLHEISLNDIDAIQRYVFEEFKEARQLFDNCQARYLLPRTEAPLQAQHAEAAEKALADIDFVFAVEQAPEVLPIIVRTLGQPKERLPAFPYGNRARLKEDVNLQDKSIRDFYRTMVGFDARVFVAARKRGEDLMISEKKLHHPS